MRGLEPPTFGTTNRCSNQLSYTHRETTLASVASQLLCPPSFRIKNLSGASTLVNNQIVDSAMSLPHNSPVLSTLTHPSSFRFAPLHRRRTKFRPRGVSFRRVARSSCTTVDPFGKKKVDADGRRKDREMPGSGALRPAFSPTVNITNH